MRYAIKCAVNGKYFLSSFNGPKNRFRLSVLRNITGYSTFPAKKIIIYVRMVSRVGARFFYLLSLFVLQPFVLYLIPYNLFATKYLLSQRICSNLAYHTTIFIGTSFTHLHMYLQWVDLWMIPAEYWILIKNNTHKEIFNQN